LKNRLKELREEKGMTQEKLARMIDVSLSQVRKIEYNMNIPSVLIAIKMKKALQLNDIEELFILEDTD
jgi:putative transcriptional regulator